MIEQQYYSNIRNSFSYKLVLCCITTIFAMYAHRFLPPKVFDVVPAKDQRAYIYGDTNSAGNSMASWTDFEGLAWQCDIENDGQQHGCGFNISLGPGIGTKGMDLSGYDKVNVELDYEGGDKRLRFYTRNYIEGFSNIEDISTSKFLNALIPIQFIKGPLTIQFSEFFVAEWWVSGNQVPRESLHPDFHNAIVFGVDLNYPTAPGIHRFKLKKLQFVGLWISAERWYLGILVFWMLVIFISGAYNLWQLKRQNKAERERLEALINQNSALEDESNHYKQLSMLDQLTGMLNRHGLSEYILKHYDKNEHENVSLIIIDIDFFKKINDAYGHDGGDTVLHKMAEVIRHNIRASDTAARWGGEEFVVVLPNTTVEEAQIVAEELRSVAALTVFENLPDLQVTISAGVGAIDGIEPFHMLFRRVDVALYQAKAQGRNRVVTA